MPTCFLNSAPPLPRLTFRGGTRGVCADLRVMTAVTAAPRRRAAHTSRAPRLGRLATPAPSPRRRRDPCDVTGHVVCAGAARARAARRVRPARSGHAAAGPTSRARGRSDSGRPETPHFERATPDSRRGSGGDRNVRTGYETRSLSGALISLP